MVVGSFELTIILVIFSSRNFEYFNSLFLIFSEILLENEREIVDSLIVFYKIYECVYCGNCWLCKWANWLFEAI